MSDLLPPVDVDALAKAFGATATRAPGAFGWDIARDGVVFRLNLTEIEALCAMVEVRFAKAAAADFRVEIEATVSLPDGSLSSTYSQAELAERGGHPINLWGHDHPGLIPTQLVVNGVLMEVTFIRLRDVVDLLPERGGGRA